MKLYIATPINARQEPTMREKLVAAKHRVEMLKEILADDVRFKNYELISTFDFNDMYDTEEKAMSRCIYHVLTSDAIYLDHGWTASKGCNLEYLTAKIYGKLIFEHSEYLTKETMKTEEIKPGDILYDEDRKMLVKVARVDEDEVVKYSAYTDMKRIFKTVPPPYRVGTRTADVYIHATDDQRKYMERNLAVCEYVNLPNNNRIETLAYIIADLKAENVELEQRVHQLVDEYNDVVRLLNGNEKRKDEDPAKLLLDNMQKMRDHCDMLEKENTELERFAKAMNEFVIDKNLYMEKGTSCRYTQGYKTVCSTYCLECGSCLGVLEGYGVICRKRLKEANVSILSL